IELWQLEIVHRDTKLDNVLISHKTKRTYLIDFGCAMWSWEGPFKTDNNLGLSIIPPELKKGVKDNNRAIVFALGVNLHVMLCSDGPINIEQIRDAPIDKPIGFPMITNEYKLLSGEAVTFLKSCLNEEPNDRATLDQLNQLDWLMNDAEDFQQL